MGDFMNNFLANLASDALFAIVIYIIITQPSERRKERAAFNQALGLLKAEAQVNRARANIYLKELAEPNDRVSELFPLRFMRGAWNALKESGALSRLNDAQLAYHLFRMNEIAYVANRNFRRYQLAFMEDTGGKHDVLAEIARKDSERLVVAIDEVLSRLEHIEVSQFPVEYFDDIEEIHLSNG